MVESSLALTVFLSALLFGSVESWSMALIGFITAITFIIAVLKLKDLNGISREKGIFLSLILFLLYTTFQLIPLPVLFLSMAHSEIKNVVTISPAVTPAFHSISVYPFATEKGLSHLFVYAMAFSIPAFGMINGKERIYTPIKILSFCGFALALFGIIQFATWNGKIYWFRELTQGGSPFGPFVNRNHFAGFVGMIIPLSLGIAFMSRTIEKKVMYAFLSVVMAIALFFSLSRGGIISFLGGIVIFSLVVFTKTLSKKRLIPVFFFLAVLAVYLFFLGMSPVIERFASTEVSNEQRLVAWQGVISAFKDYPLFGSGLGTFEYVFKVYKPGGLYLLWDHAHNDYLELLLEVGIIGVVIAGLFFFFVIKAIIKADLSDRRIYLKAGFLGSITTIVIHSVFDFNLQIPSNAMLFFLMLGMAAAMTKEQKTTSNEQRI